MPERIDTEWVLWRWTRDEEGEPIHCSECHKGYGAEKEHLPWCKVGALAQEFADRKTAQARIEALEELLQDVRASGVEFEDSRLGYVVVQIDKGTWAALAKEKKS